MIGPIALLVRIIPTGLLYLLGFLTTGPYREIRPGCPRRGFSLSYRFIRSRFYPTVLTKSYPLCRGCVRRGDTTKSPMEKRQNPPEKAPGVLNFSGEFLYKMNGASTALYTPNETPNDKRPKSILKITHSVRLLIQDPKIDNLALGVSLRWGRFLCGRILFPQPILSGKWGLLVNYSIKRMTGGLLVKWMSAR